MSGLETECKGYLRQNARGVLSDGELDQISPSGRAARGDHPVVASCGERGGGSGADRYNPGVPFDDGLVRGPGCCPAALVLVPCRAAGGSTPGVRTLRCSFEVDRAGELTMRLELPLDWGAFRLTTTPS